MKAIRIDELCPALRIEAEEARKKPGIRGLLTGLAGLDELIRGVKPGQYGIISGRTGMGKTALALNIARNITNAGKRVGFITLEMTPMQLAYRLASAATATSQRAWQEGYVSRETINEGLAALQSMDLLVNSTLNSKVDAVVQLVREMAETCDIVFVDYIQLMRTGASHRVQELALASKAVMHTAIQTKMPVVGLAQLNRDAAGIKPALHNLKGAGDLEEDSQFVIALHQEEVIDDGSVFSTSDVDRDMYELLVLKNRNGMVGTANVRFDKETMRFLDVPA